MTEVKRVMLIKTDADQNNNKFWEAVVHNDGRVDCRWGRVGANGQSKSFSGGERYLQKKMKEKAKRGYREAKVVSANATTTTVAKGSLKSIAKNQIEHSDPETAKLIDFLVQVNAHQITKASGGQLNVDTATGMIKTPLGVLTQDAIDDARTLLIELSKLRVASRRAMPRFKDAVQDYLMLVPQVVPRNRGWLDTMFTSKNDIQQQNALLDSLEATLQAIGNAPVPKNIQQDKIFDVKLILDKSRQTMSKIKGLYTSTRKRMHTSYKLMPKRIWAVDISTMRAAFERDGLSVGNIQELWHGTRASNLLSILKIGLIIPPTSSGHITGRMYGNGVYFSDQSTKALNYAHGYWSGSYSNTCYMFLADVAMGRSYTPGGYGDRSRLPRKGYDSTFAAANRSGVMNNEMIVYRVSQCNLKYLVEFS